MNKLINIVKGRNGDANTIKIVENKKLHFLLPSLILALALLFMIVNGAAGNGMFNYDVEFAGGTSMQIDLNQSADTVKNDDIAKIISDVTGQVARIQKLVGTTQVLIKMKSADSESRVVLVDALKESYPGIDEGSIQVTDVSPTVSGEMQRTAVIAIAVALAAMFVYIYIRFRDLKMGGTTIANQLLNALAVIAFYAILRVPLNDTFIIVLLTVLGYSVNSTIVVFDRVRENKKLLSKLSDDELINRSVSQTFRRSLFASLTTLFTIICLYIFGVMSIREFALPIMFGVIFGTYSSVCFAGSLWHLLSERAKTAKAA